MGGTSQSKTYQVQKEEEKLGKDVIRRATEKRQHGTNQLIESIKRDINANQNAKQANGEFVEEEVTKRENKKKAAKNEVVKPKKVKVVEGNPDCIFISLKGDDEEASPEQQESNVALEVETLNVAEKSETSNEEKPVEKLVQNDDILLKENISLQNTQNEQPTLVHISYEEVPLGKQGEVIENLISNDNQDGVESLIKEQTSFINTPNDKQDEVVESPILSNNQDELSETESPTKNQTSNGKQDEVVKQLNLNDNQNESSVTVSSVKEPTTFINTLDNKQAEIVDQPNSNDNQNESSVAVSPIKERKIFINTAIEQEGDTTNETTTVVSPKATTPDEDTLKQQPNESQQESHDNIQQKDQAHENEPIIANGHVESPHINFLDEVLKIEEEAKLLTGAKTNLFTHDGLEDNSVILSMYETYLSNLKKLWLDEEHWDYENYRNEYNRVYEFIQQSIEERTKPDDKPIVAGCKT